ncbi:MAG: hypothetical protein ACLPUG_02235 [Acidimicrobiales bacterium]
MTRGPRRTLGGAAALVTVLLALGLLAGCTGYTGSKANQVRQWASTTSVSANDGLVTQDVTAIRESMMAGRLKDVTSNCAGLVFDTGTAYGNLPTPDNTLTNELNVAYQDFANAGSSCAAARSLHSGRVKRALEIITAGVVSLDEATRRLAADGVH